MMLDCLVNFGSVAAPVLATTAWVALTAQVSMVVLVIALCLAFLRLVLGPSMPDRVVAIDLVAVLLVGLIAVSAVETGEVIFLRVAMVVALFNFIGTIGFCWYLQRGPRQ
ncbi:Na(+)/H(+) antiporter subunit F [Rosistilla carotiformis]|uniref:Na(+)/H(+) antiporter subunit F n=1 Tax=Rosistilla carotiformis TaxID=2528017 RepID=A0A518JUM1_9BACT|nr:monovalent cation/H+ antiporter complex subunit F [Rosistilla carotiformis]QDV69251.1 Na(+)/H(+) antiporter subunit F [Rosistilla carotiformis]